MSNSFIDVHVFDGSLTFYANYCNKWTVEEKRNEFIWLRNEIDPYLSLFESSTIGFDTIVINTGMPPNMDHKNNLLADDLLMYISLKLRSISDKRDILYLLCEQLDDFWKLGQCPQGRTTRLAQICQII